VTVPMQLRGRVAVVTGAGGGIGRAIALALARRGAHLALVDVDAAGLAGVAEAAVALGVRAVVRRFDVTDRVAVAALPEQVRGELGRIDLLVNNAGVAPKVRADILEGGEESFDRMVNINLKGPYFLTQLVAKRMADATRKGDAALFSPKIITITSVSVWPTTTSAFASISTIGPTSTAGCAGTTAAPSRS